MKKTTKTILIILITILLLITVNYLWKGYNRSPEKILKNLFNIELKKDQYTIEKIEDFSSLFSPYIYYYAKLKILEPIEFEKKLEQKNYIKLPIKNQKILGGVPVILYKIKKGYYIVNTDSLHPENKMELIYDSENKELIISY